MALLVCDTHVHFYPFYDLAVWLSTAKAALVKNQPDEIHAVCLTERVDCNFFSELKAGKHSAAGWKFEPTAEIGAMTARDESGFELLIFAGRQINTVERLEILALTADLNLNDGLPAEETIRRIADGGALPVLNWAPGKWFGARGELAEILLDKSLLGDLPQVLVCDTTLRPWGWPEPDLITLSRQRGIKVLRGSDPLPLAGEEKLVGSYGITYFGDFDRSLPVNSLREILTSSRHQIQPFGTRSDPVSWFLRMVKNQLNRKD